jgi:hypothetical protein
MKPSRAIWSWSTCGAGVAALVMLPSFALAQDQADLAKASQNPVAAMISLPFQNNTFFGVGPDDDTANVLNIQPVIPIGIGPVNLINRTIFPLIYLPDVTDGPGRAAGGDLGRLDLRARRHQLHRVPLAGRQRRHHLGHRPLDQPPERDRREARE